MADVVRAADHSEAALLCRDDDTLLAENRLVPGRGDGVWPPDVGRAFVRLAVKPLPAAIKVDTFSISALHLAIKVPYFSNSGHKNEKVT
eukprot:SAG31_NODE_32894_length_350_cov_1.031873_1_plen_88_part_01